MYPKILFAMVLAWLDGSALSFRSLSAVRVPRRADASPRWMQPEPETGFPHQADATLDFSNGEDKVLTSQLTSLAPACVALLAASPAEAADAVPTALWAYGHYAAMLAGMGSVVAQRFVLKNDMTKQEESLLGTLNIVYSLSLVLLLASGYFRLTEFGKGASFYSHEILFWVKMASVGVLAGLALFPTVTLVKRSMSQSADNYTPMSDALVARMGQVLNAAITGILCIPLFASLMARGVTYMEDFPLPAGIVLTALATGGASFLYGKQSLTWQEPVAAPPPAPDE